MDWEFWALTFDITGKVLVAYTALAVHSRFRREKRVDTQLVKTMRSEQIYGFLGIGLMIAAYIMKAFVI